MKYVNPDNNVQNIMDFIKASASPRWPLVHAVAITDPRESSGYILSHTSSERHPYAVHSVGPMGDRYWGHYFETYEAALRCFSDKVSSRLPPTEEDSE